MAKEWWEYYDMGCDDLEEDDEESQRIEKDFWIEQKINEEREEND